MTTILDQGARAPSGSNIQPWKAHVLTGESKVALSRRIEGVLSDPVHDALHAEEFAYYPKPWKSPYFERRRALGGCIHSWVSPAKTSNP